MEQWIVILTSVIIIATAAAVSIIVIMHSQSAPQSRTPEQTPQWKVELWNIQYGIKLRYAFPCSLTLGRYTLYSLAGQVHPVPEDTAISREHLLLYDQDGALWAWNLSAVNPARINGYRLNEPQRLQEGKRLELGNSVFLITQVQHN